MSFPVSVPPEILTFLRSYGSYYVIGHKDPDGDCIGSQLVLASALRRLGKDVHPLSPGPFERQEIVYWAGRFISNPADAPVAEAAIVVDCSSPDRIGDFEQCIQTLPTLVVDHHASGVEFGTARFIRPEIPATTILVASIIESLGLPITTEEAQLAFLGLATDTGFFRFIEPHQAIAFETAAYLTERGASPHTTDTTISHNRSFESRLLISRMIDRAERLASGSIILTYQTQQDDMQLGTRRDSDALYRLLLSVEGVRAIVVVKEKKDGCAISFRSNDEFDVGKLAGEYNGGGHQRAAGAYICRSLIDVLASFRNRLHRNDL